MRPMHGLAVAAVILAALLSGQPATRHVPTAIAHGAGSVHSLASPALRFELNRGQTDRSVRYLLHGPGYTLFLTATDAVFAFPVYSRPPAAAASGPLRIGRPDMPLRSIADLPAVREEAIRLHLSGANSKPAIAGLQRLPGTVSYFMGNDPGRWQTGVPTYAAVRYHDVYPGIDLRYSIAHGQVEYDWLIKPGANPSRIRLDVAGATGLSVDRQRNLVLRRGAITVRQHLPLIYQSLHGARQSVSGRYLLTGSRRVGFRLGSYNPNLSLVIDPEIFYSTYLGGSGDDIGVDVSADGAGNALVVGRTTSTNFPTLNAFEQAAPGARYSVFVTKLDPLGKLIFSSYLGGNASDAGNGGVFDAAGNIYITGDATSSNFPIMNAIQPQLKGGSDGFVTKFSPDGRILIYSTYLGGSRSEGASRIAVTPDGQAAVVGETDSSDFPMSHAFQPVYAGPGTTCKNAQGQQIFCYDAYVTKLSTDGRSFVFSTYLGGTEDEGGFGIALDVLGKSYVTGYTTSPNFPTDNPAQPTKGAGWDAFLTGFDANGAPDISTFIGGANDDVGSSVAVVGSNQPILPGVTPTATKVPGSNTTATPTVTLTPIGGGGVDQVVVGGDSGNGPGLWVLDRKTNQIQNLSQRLLQEGANSVSRVVPFHGPQLMVLMDADAEPATVTHGRDGTNEKFCVAIGSGSLDGQVNDIHVKGDWVRAGRDIGYVSGTKDTYAYFQPAGSTDQWEYGLGLDRALQKGNQYCFSVALNPGKTVPQRIMVGLTHDIPGSADTWIGLVDAAPAAGSSARAGLRAHQAAAGTNTTLMTFDVASNGFTPNFLGDIHGSGNDYSSGLAVDGTGNVYVAGATTSTQFPLFNPAQAQYGGGPDDAYVVKLANSAPVPVVVPTATPTPAPTAKPTAKPKAKKKCKKGYKVVHGKCKKVKKKKP